MDEYIDREAAVTISNYAADEHPYEKLGTSNCSEYNEGWNDACDYIRDKLENAQAADVQPVVRSTWEFPIFTDSDDGLDPRVKCSVCGNVEAAFVRWKYCPNCGARMDGKEPDNEVSES